MRYWIPTVAALACLAAATMAPTVISFVLIIAAFGFIIDVSTKLFENAGKTGGLGDHRQ